MYKVADTFKNKSGTEKGSDSNHGHETTSGNTQNSNKEKYVYRGAETQKKKGTAGGSNYSQGHKSTPGNTTLPRKPCWMCVPGSRQGKGETIIKLPMATLEPLPKALLEILAPKC